MWGGGENVGEGHLFIFLGGRVLVCGWGGGFGGKDVEGAVKGGILILLATEDVSLASVMSPPSHSPSPIFFLLHNPTIFCTVPSSSFSHTYGTPSEG